MYAFLAVSCGYTYREIRQMTPAEQQSLCDNLSDKESGISTYKDMKAFEKACLMHKGGN